MSKVTNTQQTEQQKAKMKVLGLQALAEVSGGGVVAEQDAWSTFSDGCGTVKKDEWSTFSDGCPRTAV